MSNFLILKRIGPEPRDLEVVNVVESSQLDSAIADSAPQDVGWYEAVPYDDKIVDRQKAQRTVRLSPVTPEDEAAAAGELNTDPPLGASGVVEPQVSAAPEPETKA